MGDTVTWSNAGPTPHSATASDGSFDTGILDKGGSGSHTFTQAGTFAYICTPHPYMKGTVVVQASASGDSDGLRQRHDRRRDTTGTHRPTTGTGAARRPGSTPAAWRWSA